jgi:hypothetical protein
MSSDLRKYLYGVAAVAVALLVGYGLLTQDQAPLWLGLIGAILWAAGNLTAIQHTTSVGRAAVYGVAVAVVALLVGYNLLAPTQAPLWLALLAGVLGVGTNVLAFTKVTPDVVPGVVVDDGGADMSDGMAS